VNISKEMRIQYKPIGIIHSPFKQPEGTPIQAAFTKNGEGTVELFPQFKQGLKDLEGFSHIILIYHFHKSKGYDLACRPFLDKVKRGLFATRAPSRPNPIGLSIVRLQGINDGILSVSSLDVIDGTPLIDIKPYIPQFDSLKTVKVGWFEKAFRKKHPTIIADNRFVEKKTEE
jgi:tRNA-Thr(GGU) m(6)t(6)A37 methyltransferase TsaA